MRRVERKEAFYGNNELSADRSPNPNFQGRWRKEQSEAPTNDRKRSADDRFCSYHNSFAHWENDCRALKRMKNGTQSQSEINVLQYQKSEANALTAKLPLVLIGFTDSKNRPLYVIADTESTPNLVARSCVLNNDLQNKVKQISQMNKAIGEGNGVRSLGLIDFPLFFNNKQVTVPCQILRDEDMPQGRKFIFGNNHQALEERDMIVHFKESTYYTNSDDGTRLAIPTSVEEFFSRMIFSTSA